MIKTYLEHGYYGCVMDCATGLPLRQIDAGEGFTITSTAPTLELVNFTVLLEGDGFRVEQSEPEPATSPPE